MVGQKFLQDPRPRRGKNFLVSQKKIVSGFPDFLLSAKPNNLEKKKFLRQGSMNIFFLSWFVQECAEWHFDRHVVKMILELAQLLSTAHHILDPVRASKWEKASQEGRRIYRKTHTNHPRCIFVSLPSC
jgi:hypothetical protein